MIKKLLLLLTVVPVIALTGCMSQRESAENEVQIQAEEPDEEQIQADLIGSSFTWGEEGAWYFVALSEFENLTINGKITRGNVLEYDVTMLLKDFEIQKHFIMEAFLVYKKNNNRWQLISYLIKDFREMEIQTD